MDTPIDAPALPVDVLRAVAARSAPPSLADLRLASRTMAVALDIFVTRLVFTEWPLDPVSSALSCTTGTRLQNVEQLVLRLASARPSDPQDATGMASCGKHEGLSNGAGTDLLREHCKALKTLTKMLPGLRAVALDPCMEQSLQLTWLPCSLLGALTGLTRLDMPYPPELPAGAVQLCGLRAAAFSSNEVPARLPSVVALAPRLRQLSARRLEMTIPPQTTAQGGNNGHVHVCLPSLTHLGAESVTVYGASTGREAAAALGAAAPAMHVLFRVPQVYGGVLGSGGDADGVAEEPVTSSPASYDELLFALPSVCAVRGRAWFSSRSWFSIQRAGSPATAGHFASPAWANVSRISFHSGSYPDGCSDFECISKCVSLHQVRLSFSYPYTKADNLVRELATLPALAEVALPAALFCGRCCPEKHYPSLRTALEALAASPSLSRLILLSPAAPTPGSSYYCGHDAAVRDTMAALGARTRELRGARAGGGGSGCHGGCGWTAHCQGSCGEPLQLALVVEPTEWADEGHPCYEAAGHHTWGVYVPVGEC
jgi:hypothetical protein